MSEDSGVRKYWASLTIYVDCNLAGYYLQDAYTQCV